MKEFDFDPRELGKHSDKQLVVPSKAQEMIIMVGPPGSGKSYMSVGVLSEYTHINQDTLKTIDKCVKGAQTAVSNGKSVVIDNQNKDKQTRSQFIKIAKSAGIPCRCVLMDVPKDLPFHLNRFRSLAPTSVGARAHKVPSVVIHTFFKRLEPPTIDEGFSDVINIKIENITPGPFKNDMEKILFHSFLG
eukprot:GHVR01096652.1.p1 GENE.GHVR01096652.1~~GHVR01096652.1.p1  ORF type:complete len:189 (-),score=39.38 GHVR01096652.1:206-772(-)